MHSRFNSYAPRLSERLSSSFSASRASIRRLRSRTRSLRAGDIMAADVEGLGDIMAAADDRRSDGVGVLGGVTGGLKSWRRAEREGPVTLPDELVRRRRLEFLDGAPGGVIRGV
jgi:hypothetical protein